MGRPPGKLRRLITPAGLATVRKAIVGGVTALIGSLTTALSDGSITPTEITVAVLTGLVAGLGVYSTTNADPLSDG